MRISWRAMIVVAALALAGCGFHLREQAQLPESLRRLHLEIADPGSLLHRDLPDALERAGAQVEEKAATGIATLRIPLSTLAPETLSVGATARVREYTMRYRVGKLQRILGPVATDPHLRLDVAVALRALEIVG